MRFVLAIIICLFGIGAVNAGDVAGSTDHPLIPRYEGSEIVSYDVQEFTDYRLMVAKATVYGGLDKRGGTK